MTLRYLEMNQHDSLYRVARAYPGGIEALAKRMDKSPNVLRNKLRPDITTHHITFEEMTEIVELCQAARVREALQPVHALVGRLGMVAFEAPSFNDVTDDLLLETVYKVMMEIGEVAQTVTKALEDKKITHPELDDIEAAFSGGMSALAEWRERVRTRAVKDSGPIPAKKTAKTK